NGETEGEGTTDNRPSPSGLQANDSSRSKLDTAVNRSCLLAVSPRSKSRRSSWSLAKSRLSLLSSLFSLASRAPHAEPEVSIRLQLLEGHRRRGRRRPQAGLGGGAQVRLRGLHHRHPLARPREAVAAGGGDRAGGQGAGVRAAGGLRRRPVRARGLRGRALPRPRRGARLQRLRAACSQRGRAPRALPRRHPRRLPPRPRRVRRRGLPLRATGHPGHGGEGQGHHHLHGLLGVGHRLRRLLRSKQRQVCPAGAVPVAGQGVPAGRRAHCACDHRRRHRREEVADEEQQGRRRHGGRGRGPGRGGAELLARPRPGQERLDAGDGHPVAVLHVAAAASRRCCTYGPWNL
uniref:Uncharacterized protein n=1 Tax=Zea mays TaxID=4577 RepID=A0A804LUV1_MAIZE